MNYITERYEDLQRFNKQYEEIYQFLLTVADSGYNEHFHWGRFEWMHQHTMLDIDKLDRIGIFRNTKNKIVGLVTYDTCFDDGAYLIHFNDDDELLRMMIDFAIRNYGENGKAVIKPNSKDLALLKTLSDCNFSKTWTEESILELDLEKTLEFQVQEGYTISPENFNSDNWKYQMVIHKGFDHADIPEPWLEEFFEPTPNFKKELKVFAINEKGEYCAHCGMWYTKGNTAYVEPVVTIPECRNTGLAKAVVYETARRAKKLGAARVIVLSGQEFYYKLGFEFSSEFECWECKI